MSGQRFHGDIPQAPEFERRRRCVLEHVRVRTMASRKPLYFVRSGFFKSRSGIVERPVEFMQVKCFKVLWALPPPSNPPSNPSSRRLPARPEEHTTELEEIRPTSPPPALLHTLLSLCLSFCPSLSSFFPSISYPSFSPLPRPVFPLTSTIVHPLSFCDSECLKQSVCLRGWMIDSRERARQLSGDR